MAHQSNLYILKWRWAMQWTPECIAVGIMLHIKPSLHIRWMVRWKQFPFLAWWFFRHDLIDTSVIGSYYEMGSSSIPAFLLPETDLAFIYTSSSFKFLCTYLEVVSWQNVSGVVLGQQMATRWVFLLYIQEEATCLVLFVESVAVSAVT